MPFRSILITLFLLQASVTVTILYMALIGDGYEQIKRRRHYTVLRQR